MGDAIMHLNKRGWGLSSMLIASGVLFFFLLIAIYLIYRFYSSFEHEVGNNYYYKLEEKLENQAKIYLDDYYDGSLNSDGIIISRSTLKDYDLDILLVDRNDNSCSGFVFANKSRAIVNTKAYIKCQKYVTEGYDDVRK